MLSSARQCVWLWPSLLALNKWHSHSGIGAGEVCTASRPLHQPNIHACVTACMCEASETITAFPTALLHAPLLPPPAGTTPTPCRCRPFGVAIGGCKVADKLPVLEALIQKADVVVIGGRMAFTFLAAAGVAVGKTQIEENWLEVRWDEGGGRSRLLCRMGCIGTLGLADYTQVLPQMLIC